MHVARLATVAGLLLTVTVVRVLVDRPSLAIGFYALIPIILAAFWFGRVGSAVTVVAAIALYVGSEVTGRWSDLGGVELLIAALNRGAVYVGVGVLVTVLIERERGIAQQVVEQQRQLDELEALRSALTPAEVPARPRLELATSFTPAEGVVAGDFFLVVPGPADSTTVVVGDVVGHGLEAARCAAYVRTALATFAAFSTDPVQLLRMANTALVEKVGDPTNFVTAVCLNISTPPAVRVQWACAGHEPPWQLDTGDPLVGGTGSVPLGLSRAELLLEAGIWTMDPGAGLIVFTDGLTEGRAAHRRPGHPVELFGDDRARKLVGTLKDRSPTEIVNALTVAVTDFAGGRLADDLCIIACRVPSGHEEPALAH